MVDLWAGFGAFIIGFLALGLRVITLAFEPNQEARDALRLSFPDVILLDSLDQFKGDMVSQLVKKKELTGIIVNGGCVKQGLPAVTASQKAADKRRPAQWVRRISSSIRAVCSVPVVECLENSGSVSGQTRDFTSQCLTATPCFINASTFGWIDRPRIFWITVNGVNFDWSTCVLPPDLKWAPGVDGGGGTISD